MQALDLLEAYFPVLGPILRSEFVAGFEPGRSPCFSGSSILGDETAVPYHDVLKPTASEKSDVTACLDVTNDSARASKENVT